jgi:GTP cyclohydrolase II
MSGNALNGAPGWFGTQSQISVTRAVAEFHTRRPVHIVGQDETVLALPVDGLQVRSLEAFRTLAAPSLPSLVITAERARALGIDSADPVVLDLAPNASIHSVHALTADAKTAYSGCARPARMAAQAAIRLAKLSQGLPAVLVANTARAQVSCEGLDLMRVEAQAISAFTQEIAESLTISGKALVPLTSGARAEFIVFRDALGGNSTAIIVGQPDCTKPVLVRLHSACLTGDVFGSRRCDCGDQLKLAIERLQQAGAGIILYLAQEGRGVGLANKMRAYQMQDQGLDTVDANTTLGFEDDERDYRIAGRMLQMLGCRSVVLLTNNPAKLEGLAQAGIEIAGRMPIETPINADNVRYLTAKASRAGHQLEHILKGLGHAAEKVRDEAPATQ